MNRIEVSGYFAKVPTCIYIGKDKIYRGDFVTQRTSGDCDVISCVVPELYADMARDENRKLSIVGEIRTRRVLGEDGKSHLDIYVYVMDMCDCIGATCMNDVTFEGIVVKNPVVRTTPRGKLIADLLIVFNRPNGKPDYVPCIAWGSNAARANDISVGDVIFGGGRLQSREYEKKNLDGSKEIKVAYELSINSMEITEGGNDSI